MLFFFFFQAEDGIRDGRVTGVQTCALPICGQRAARSQTFPGVNVNLTPGGPLTAINANGYTPLPAGPLHVRVIWSDEIGRASCRERVEMSGVAVSLKKKNREGRGGWRCRSE